MAEAAKSEYTSEDGVFFREWLPSGAVKGAFLLLHGMESHSGWFDGLATGLARDGWASVSFDQPGWGRSAGTRGHLESYREFVSRTASAASAAREKFGSLHLAGMSWGGLASLYLTLRRGWLFDSLTLLAPGFERKRPFPLAELVKVGYAAVRPAAARGYVDLDFAPGDFTSDPAMREFVRNDELRNHRVSRSFLFETFKMRKFVEKTIGKRRLPPAQCLLAGQDAIVDNRAAEAMCRRGGIRTEMIPESSHTLVFDIPGRTAELLARHAEAASSGRGRASRRVWIVGAGAVGGGVGSLLASGGHAVSLLVKPAHKAIVDAKGFMFRTGDSWRRPGPGLAAHDNPAEMPEDPDLVIAAVKSYDTAAAMEGLKGLFGERAVIASLQNGVDNEPLLRTAFPRNPIIAAAICASLELVEPGSFFLADDNGGLAGSAYGGDEGALAGLWSEILPASRMECSWTGGERAAERVKWSKLMLNVLANALNSATGMSTRELLEDDRYGNLAVNALREGFRVMRKLGIRPVDLPGYPMGRLSTLVGAPNRLVRKVMAWQAGRSAEAPLSMRQDVLKKRGRTEIDHINGAVAREGERLGVDVTANKRLCEMVRNAGAAK